MEYLKNVQNIKKIKQPIQFSKDEIQKTKV